MSERFSIKKSGDNIYDFNKPAAGEKSVKRGNWYSKNINLVNASTSKKEKINFNSLVNYINNERVLDPNAKKLKKCFLGFGGSPKREVKAALDLLQSQKTAAAKNADKNNVATESVLSASEVDVPQTQAIRGFSVSEHVPFNDFINQFKTDIQFVPLRENHEFNKTAKDITHFIENGCTGECESYPYVYESGDPIHGEAHISRGVLFAEVIGLYHTHVLKEPVDLDLLRWGFVFHDMGRLGRQGEDKWEADSANLFKSYLAKVGVAESDSKGNIILKPEDPIHQGAPSVEARAIAAADSIEIMRPGAKKGDINPINFQRNLFGFLKEAEEGSDAHLFRETFIKEAYSLITFDQAMYDNYAKKHQNLMYLQALNKLKNEGSVLIDEKQYPNIHAFFNKQAKTPDISNNELILFDEFNKCMGELKKLKEDKEIFKKIQDNAAKISDVDMFLNLIAGYPPGRPYSKDSDNFIILKVLLDLKAGKEPDFDKIMGEIKARTQAGTLEWSWEKKAAANKK